MSVIRTLNATEFKATCLDVLDRVGDREIDRVLVTKRGRVVAVLTPPEQVADSIAQLHGFMRGSVLLPSALDLTAPVLDEKLLAEEGHLHF